MQIRNITAETLMQDDHFMLAGQMMRVKALAINAQDPDLKHIHFYDISDVVPITYSMVVHKHLLMQIFNQ